MGVCLDGAFGWGMHAFLRTAGIVDVFTEMGNGSRW